MECRGGRFRSRDILSLVVTKSREITLIFFFQAEDGIRDYKVTGVQTCALPISSFGVCALDHVCGSPGDVAQRMVRAADAALYESKLRGRDRVTADCIAETEERVSRA